MLPGMPPPREDQIKELERLGESEVRYLLVSEPGLIHSHHFERHVAEEWLRQKGQEREIEAFSKRDDREIKILKIAEKASADARSARITAIIAATIAAAATIISAVIKANTP